VNLTPAGMTSGFTYTDSGKWLSLCILILCMLGSLKAAHRGRIQMHETKVEPTGVSTGVGASTGVGFKCIETKVNPDTKSNAFESDPGNPTPAIRPRLCNVSLTAVNNPSE